MHSCTLLRDTHVFVLYVFGITLQASGVCGHKITNVMFTLLHKCPWLPRQQSRLPQLHRGRRACRAGYGPRRCLGSSVFAPGWSENEGKEEEMMMVAVIGLCECCGWNWSRTATPRSKRAFNLYRLMNTFISSSFMGTNILYKGGSQWKSNPTLHPPNCILCDI